MPIKLTVKKAVTDSLWEVLAHLDAMDFGSDQVKAEAQRIDNHNIQIKVWADGDSRPPRYITIQVKEPV